MDDLDDLLAESLQQAAERKAVKESQKKLKAAGANSRELQEDRERVERWQAEHAWTPVANVALYERHKCECGRQQTIFRHLMRRETHKHMRTVQRFIAVEESLANLPNEVAVQKWKVPQCTYCAQEKGFHLGSGNVYEWEGN